MGKQKAFKEFQCPFCNKMFTKRGLQGHVRFIHQKEVRVIDGEIVGLNENLPEKIVVSEIKHDIPFEEKEEITNIEPIPETEEEPVETNVMEMPEKGSIGNYWICPKCGKEHRYPPGVFKEIYPLHSDIICPDCTEEEPDLDTEEEPDPDIEDIRVREKEDVTIADDQKNKTVLKSGLFVLAVAISFNTIKLFLKNIFKGL